MSNHHVDPDDTDLTFALQIAGAELADTPPAPDSPLGQLRLFAAARPGVKLEADHVRQAIDGSLGKLPQNDL
ncbi:hypothetical protein [Streptomyces sp. NRRL F-5065]|uniref:hypothetical protein n=1 Tax=Streptomyces sp. NRRL F-5065 TaxID=1463855 RepID=UPI00056477B8|nr:hypothetical protein [Streptomyces sp. NRRL F-5065]